MEISHPKHYCETCWRELVNECYILCTKCHGFTQCLNCFAQGYEKGTHLKTHPYILMKASTPNLFTSDWTIEEEIILLDSIIICGLGNWNEVSRHVESKDPNECESHYFGIYCDQLSSPLPTIPDEIQPPIPLPPPLPFSTQAIESCPTALTSNFSAKSKNQIPAEYSKYMVRRGEFEEEFEDDAEIIISDISFDEDTDTYESIQEKLVNLTSYNSVLDERLLQTETAIEWEIHYNLFKTLGGSTPAEKEADVKILPLAPYIGKEKTKELAKYLHEQRRQREKIDNRLLWQANGVPTIHEGFLFQTLKDMVKDEKLAESDIPKWNQYIENYIKEHGRELSEDTKKLSPNEIDLCKINDISTPLYLALKDGIMREYTARGGRLSKDDAVAIQPEYAKVIEEMYNLYVSNGWIFSF